MKERRWRNMLIYGMESLNACQTFYFLFYLNVEIRRFGIGLIVAKLNTDGYMRTINYMYYRENLNILNLFLTLFVLQKLLHLYEIDLIF